MKTGLALFRVTAIVVFLQLLLGGLLTFDLISAGPHIVMGFVVFVLAIACMAVAWVTKPAFMPLRVMSVVLVLLLVVQIILGFATLGTASAALAWVHFVNALAIYGIAVSAAFMAMRWSSMSVPRTEPGTTEQSPGSA